MTAQILVIDDDPKFHEFISDVLQPLNVKVLHAQEVRIALGMIVTNPPHLILMDLHLQKHSGAEVARQLKDSAVRNIPIIAVTGSTDSYDMQHAIDAGCDDFLPKTTPPHDMRTLIGRYIED